MTDADAAPVREDDDDELSDTPQEEAEGEDGAQNDEKAKGICRRTWTATEDERLQHIVAQLGPRQWPQIAAHRGTRKDWQCRERWHNHLGPMVKKGSWSAEEDRAILQAVATVGQVSAHTRMD